MEKDANIQLQYISKGFKHTNSRDETPTSLYTPKNVVARFGSNLARRLPVFSSLVVREIYYRGEHGGRKKLVGIHSSMDP